MHGRMRFSSLIILSLLCCGSMLANPTDTFRLANESLRQGAVKDAIHLYETLVDRGYSSVALHFNLGTAHAQVEDWVNARLHLERALHMAPLDKEITQNLDLVRDKIGAYYRFPQYPLDSTIATLNTYLGRSFLPLLQFVLFATLLALLHRWRQTPTESLKRLVFTAAGMMLLVLPLTVAQQLEDRRFSKMLILVQEHDLLQQPTANSTSLEKLPAGAKLMVQEKFGSWWQVMTATGDEGWIQAEAATQL